MSHAALLESVPVDLLVGLLGGGVGWLLRGLRERRVRAEQRRLLISLLEEAAGSTRRPSPAVRGEEGCGDTAKTRVYVRPAGCETEAETAVFCMSAEMQAQLGRGR